MGWRGLRGGFGKVSPETRVTERRNLGLACPSRSQNAWAGTEPKRIAGRRRPGAPPEAPALPRAAPGPMIPTQNPRLNATGWTYALKHQVDPTLLLLRHRRERCRGTLGDSLRLCFVSQVEVMGRVCPCDT